MNLKEQITEIAEEAIRNNVFPGCVIGVVKKNGERMILPFGHFTYESDSPSVNADTIYDVASITKSIPTAALALMLIDQGKIRLDDRLIDYLPEFRNSDRENVLIKHLLTYGLDGYGLSFLKERSADEIVEVLMTKDFEKRPGTVFKYTNIPSTLLGFALEKILGTTLDRSADQYFFTPLGMSRTTFFPERFPQDEIPPTETDDWRGEVRGIVHDESAYVFKKAGRIVGHAGLFSTAADLVRFVEMLLCGGELDGKRYFSEAIIGQMETNQIPELGDFMGLGFELNQFRLMGKHAGEHTFGKTGFTGTIAVCDREKGVAYVILSNRTYPKRSADSSAINAFRARIGEIVLGDEQ